jgi:thiamine biosynthesis lipoprotein
MKLGDRTLAETTSFAMDTVITYKVFGERPEEALAAAKRETARLEGILSCYKPDSEISRINKSAGKKYEVVSSDTYEVLARAKEFSEICKGCFDITIGPLVDLWREAKAELKAPTNDRLQRTLPLIDYNDLRLDSSKHTVMLKNKGQSIDLGGIGKGYAAEKVLEVLKDCGIISAFTNFGGNVAAIGSKPDRTPWRIGIQHPRQVNKLVGVLSIRGKSVVTSGDYQRYFIGGDGNRYHHILDPATGYPAASGLIGATVITANSMEADALSTMLFVAGLQRSAALLKAFPEADAVLIDKDLQVYITEGLKDDFTPTEGINIHIIK